LEAAFDVGIHSMASPLNVAHDAASYEMDPGKSRFQVKATAIGMLSAFGHNPTVAIRGFTGEAWFRPQAPEESSMRLRIDAGSLAISGAVNEKDRNEMERVMKQELLETDRYPEIAFAGCGTAATKIADGMYRIALDGKLKMHGVEKNVQFPCNVIVGEDTLRANGEFTIRQTEYRIRLVSVAGGTLKLKDELKFSFDIMAHRKRAVGNE
jgi:polyisoprenoid-binding protein YceI